MEETITIRVRVKTDCVGSENEIEEDFSAEEWAGMSINEKEKAARDLMYDLIEWNWETVS